MNPTITCDDNKMVKIKPPGTPPSPLPSSDVSQPQEGASPGKSTPAGATPGSGDQSKFETGNSTSFREQAGENMPGSPVAEAFESESGKGALSVENAVESADSEDEFFDALESIEEAQALLEEPDEEFFDTTDKMDSDLFKVGNMQMSRADIKKTISIVEQMETVVIGEMDRLLANENNPKGVPPTRGHPKGVVEVPSPDGGKRSITARSPKDSIQSVKERFFNRKARKQLLHLTRTLPKVTSSDGSKKKMSEFKREILRMLIQPTVELYQIRTLLPIKESGSLKGVEADGGAKPAPEYERVTSNMLKEKAEELGVLD